MLKTHRTKCIRFGICVLLTEKNTWLKRANVSFGTIPITHMQKIQGLTICGGLGSGSSLELCILLSVQRKQYHLLHVILYTDHDVKKISHNGGSVCR
jgi:hypothetical protein